MFFHNQIQQYNQNEWHNNQLLFTHLLKHTCCILLEIAMNNKKTSGTQYSN